MNMPNGFRYDALLSRIARDKAALGPLAERFGAGLAEVVFR